MMREGRLEACRAEGAGRGVRIGVMKRGRGVRIGMMKRGRGVRIGMMKNRRDEEWR